MASAKSTSRKRKREIYAGFIPLINYRPKGHYSLNVCRGNWTADEDRKVNELQALHGNKWTLIMSFLPGRSKYSVRNRWHVINKIKNPKKIVTNASPTPHTPHSTVSISETQNVISATQNVAKRATTSERIPTHKLFNKKISNDEDGPRSTEPTSVTRTAVNATTYTSEPAIVVSKKEVKTASNVETRNISKPDEIPSEVIHQLSPLDSHSVNHLQEDMPNHKVIPFVHHSINPNHNVTIQSPSLPTYDSMAFDGAEGEEQSSVDDPSFAYAVAFAASLINAEDNSWLLHNISDGYESEHSGDALVDSE